MADNNDRILNKLDNLQDDVSEIKVTLARNTTSLEHHMLRTSLNEENIDILRKQMYTILGAAAAVVAIWGLIQSLHAMGIIKL